MRVSFQTLVAICVILASLNLVNCENTTSTTAATTTGATTATTAATTATTKAATTEEPKKTSTTVPPTTSQDVAPWNAPNTSTATAGAVFFTIGGLIIFAQIIYCYMWTKKDAEERAKFHAEGHDTGMVDGANGSQIDMKGDVHQH